MVFEGGFWPEGGVVRAEAGKIEDSASWLDVHAEATPDDAGSLEYLTQHRCSVVVDVIVHDLLRYPTAAADVHTDAVDSAAAEAGWTMCVVKEVQVQLHLKIDCE